MMDYFKTTGKVTKLYNKDGTVKGYHVGREGSGDVFLMTLIDEYSAPGNFVHIDKWGNPWVKAKAAYNQ